MATPTGYGLPVWGGGGPQLDVPSAEGLFSTAGHGPPASPSPAPAKPTPSIAYNPIDNSMFVNGQVVKMDDYAGLANSPTALTQPPVPKPDSSWHDLPMSSYQGIINDIKDPTLATVAKRNFEQALYGMTQVGYGAVGAVSGAVGATGVQDWANRGAEQASAEQDRFSPFNYQFGLGRDDDNIKAFVGAIAQAAPWLAESLISAGAGGVVALGGRAVLQSALGKYAAKQALTEVEKAALKQASRTAFNRGAIGGIAAGSYGTGVGDVYNESQEAGHPDPGGALLRGIPYAITDALPTVGALALGLGKLGRISKYVGGKPIYTRIGAGAGAGALGEGINEAIQEKILIGERNSLEPGYEDTPEAANRLLQAGLGGGAPGLLMGGLAGGVSPRIKTDPNVSTNLLTLSPGAAEGVQPSQQVNQLRLPSPALNTPMQGDLSAIGSRTRDLFDTRENFELTPPNPLLPRDPGALADRRNDRRGPPPGGGFNPAQSDINFTPDPDQQTLPGIIPAPDQTMPAGMASLLSDRRGDQRQRNVQDAFQPGQQTLDFNQPQQGQMRLFPDPAHIIPMGQANLMRTGQAPVQEPATSKVVPIGQAKLQFNAPAEVKAATKGAALKKGKANAKGIYNDQGQTIQRGTSGLTPVQPSPVGGGSNIQQPSPGQAPVQQAQAPVAQATPKGKARLIKKAPPTVAAPAVAKKPVLPPPVTAPVAQTKLTSNDAAVEDHFSGSKFAQQTLEEAQADKSEMQWFNSVAQAIKQKPALADAIKSYIDDLSPGSADKFTVWQEGDKTHDGIAARGRRVASLKVEPVSGRVAGRTASTEAQVEKSLEASPESKLSDLIKNKFNLETKAAFTTKVKELYSNVKDKALQVSGHKLSDYFTNGEPNIMRTKNRNVLVPFEVTDKTKAEFVAREKALRAEAADLRSEFEEEDATEARRVINDTISEQVSDEMSNDAAADKWNTNSYVSADTGETVQPQTIGRLRLKAMNILSKFKITPELIHVNTFSELPDFIKAELTSKGDRNVAAVSYRNQVYLITDQIKGDDHLRAVLLHEILGHFGFRSLVDDETLQKLFADIYEHDPIIRAEADDLAATGRYKNREPWQLVEEALSERAADIPNNIVYRVWRMLKSALRKIGLPIDNYREPGHLARALLSISNQYVRYGIADHAFSHKPSNWANAILASVTPPRVSTHVGAEDIVTRNVLAGGFNQRSTLRKSLEKQFTATILKPNISNLFRDLMNNLKSVNDVARKSGGFRKIYEVFQRETRRIHELLNTYNEDTKLLHSSSFTPAEQEVLGKLLSQTTRSKLPLLNDAVIRDIKLLALKADGGAVVDTNALAKLKAMGRYTVADFAKGIEIQYIIDRAVTAADIAGEQAKKDAKIKVIQTTANARMAKATTPEEKKGIVDDQNREVAKAEMAFNTFKDEGVVTVKKTRREDPIVVPADSDIWKAYNIARDALDQSQIDMLLAKHATHKLDAEQAYRHAIHALAGSEAEASKVIKAFGSDVSKTFQTMMQVNMQIDQDTGRVMLDPTSNARANTMLDRVYSALKDEKYTKDLIEYFPEAHVAKLADQIKEIRELNKLVRPIRFRGNVLDFIAGLRTQFTETLGMEEAEMYAKRSIAGGHVALRRYGDYEVSIVLKDGAGNTVTPSQNWDNNLMYMRMENQGDAESTAAEINKSWGDHTFDVIDENGNSVKVSPHAFARSAETVAPLGHKLSLYDFMTVADRLGVHLSAQNRETVIKALTKADSKARRSLQRGGNPGEEKDMVRIVSEQLESAAHIVASKENKRELDRIMADDEPGHRGEIWFGNPQDKLDWTAARDKAQGSGQLKMAYKYQRLLDQYQLEYGNAQKDAPYYRALANNLREWRAEQGNLIAKKENRVLTNTRSLVSTSQLGGYVFNLASAGVQLFTLITHVPGYLATYNPKTAYGGGFGPRVYTEIMAAARDVGHWSLGDISKLKNKLDSLNLTANEKRFLLDETKEGVFQAAAFNALQNSKLGTVRMFGHSNYLNAKLQKWMQFFSWSEEMNRRITGMAAYRLFYERAVQSGETTEEAHQLATKEARTAVYATQGDYSLLNRPAWARSGFASLLFMYKMFPILTVQLVKNMPLSGKMMFGGTMLLLGGFKSLPFAEDILDILDGITQRTGLGAGITRGNSELALREFVDTFLPGLAPIAARGLLDSVTQASLSSRIGVGDIIPGTGFARAGKGLGTVAEDLQGPAGGFISALYKMSTAALKGNFDKALREQPVTAVRNVVQGISYINNGAILNRRGYVVADDPTNRETIGRFLGFYPERQAKSNEFIAATKISIDYAKELKGDFVSRYVAAKLGGDNERAARILSEVNAWNQDAKGTELELYNVGADANRAYAAARRPQIKTFEKSAPAAIRRERQQLESLFGVSQ